MIFLDPEKLQREEERREMENAADTLVLESIMNKLTKDETIMLSKFLLTLFDLCSQARSVYFAGVLAGISHIKYHTNIDCFRASREENLHEESSILLEQQEQQESSILLEQQEQQPKKDDEETRLNVIKYNAECKQYGVSPYITAGPDGDIIEPSYLLTRVACNNCEVTYPSLKDRMLSRPGVEGCSGCQQKAKHG